MDNLEPLFAPCISCAALAIERPGEFPPALCVLAGLEGIVKCDAVQNAIVLGLQLVWNGIGRALDGKCREHLVSDLLCHRTPSTLGGLLVEPHGCLAPAVRVHYDAIIARRGIEGDL